MVVKWINEINLLSDVALTQPQAAYACFVGGYKHKLTYFMRTIPDMVNLLKPLDEIIEHKFIPAITGGHIVNEKERNLLALPPRFGGMGINIFAESSPIEYENSVNMTKTLVNQILSRRNEEDAGKTKYTIKAERNERHKQNLETIRNNMSNEEKNTINLNIRSGVSSWLTTLPLKEYGYDLSKQQFWDAVKIRYNWHLDRLPTNCICGSRFDLTHALSCKKGGFVTLRHNEVRNITASLLREVTHDVRVEPKLQEVTGERFQQCSANKKNEARLDVSASSFWVPGQRLFLDIRVFNAHALRYRNLEVTKSFKINETEKKRQYNERVLQVENGTFTPLVFATNGSMGEECKAFYKRLSEMIAKKRSIPLSVATNTIRSKICFSLLRSTIRCVRGSRALNDREINLNDFELANLACINFQ